MAPVCEHGPPMTPIRQFRAGLANYLGSGLTPSGRVGESGTMDFAIDAARPESTIPGNPCHAPYTDDRDHNQQFDQREATPGKATLIIFPIENLKMKVGECSSVANRAATTDGQQPGGKKWQFHHCGIRQVCQRNDLNVAVPWIRDDPQTT